MSKLEGVKTGDLLYVQGRGGASLSKVQRVTATQAIVNNAERYRLSDGVRVGSTDPFFRGFASVATAEQVNKVLMRSRIVRAKRKCESLKVTDANIAAVEAFLASTAATGSEQ